MKIKTLMFLASFTCVTSALGQNKDSTSTVSFDTAPGNVGATGVLGLASDDMTVVRNPRDLTVLINALDNKNSFGISVAPARTPLLPMQLTHYAAQRNGPAYWWNQALTNATFGFAQSSTEVSAITVNRRAVSFETSLLFDDEDDPFLKYYDALEAGSDLCKNIIGASKPGPGGNTPVEPDPESTKLDNARAEACRNSVDKALRWNASRAWLSYATGNYSRDGQSGSRTLGQRIVLGATYGYGKASDPVKSAWTIAASYARNAPTIQSLVLPAPSRKNTALIFAQAAIGSRSYQFILQGSNIKDETPDVTERNFKRALGLDVRLREGVWVLVRAGRQRKIDNSGDETVSTFGLNISPTMALKLQQ